MSENIIGDRIRYLRQEMGLTRRELAGETGLSPDVISKCEAGGSYAVDGGHIPALAKALRVKPGYLADTHDYTLGRATYQFQLCSDPDKLSVLAIQFPRALDDNEAVRLTSLWDAAYDPAVCLTSVERAALLRRVLDKFCESAGIPEWRTVSNPISGLFVLDARHEQKGES